MAKTGNEDQPGTAEGAAMGRAMHSLHSDKPVLDDSWAIHLLSPETRQQVQSMNPEDGVQVIEGFDSNPVLAVNIGGLRYAEDLVEACVKQGIDQYLVLGAGLDTFALRRDDLVDRCRVFEVDHPDTQALKRQRIAEAQTRPASMPEFIAVDFETDSLLDKIRGSAYDAEKLSVVSWLNTIPYLTEEAVSATLSDLAQVMAAGSKLVLNYPADIEFSAEQIEFITQLMKYTDLTNEPMLCRWTPDAFEGLLQWHGFDIVEHATEVDLTERYFENREDGFAPGLPFRVITSSYAG